MLGVSSVRKDSIPWSKESRVVWDIASDGVVVCCHGFLYRVFESQWLMILKHTQAKQHIQATSREMNQMVKIFTLYPSLYFCYDSIVPLYC